MNVTLNICSYTIKTAVIQTERISKGYFYITGAVHVRCASWLPSVVVLFHHLPPNNYRKVRTQPMTLLRKG